MKEHELVENLEVIQRILLCIVKRETISLNDIKSLEKLNNNLMNRNMMIDKNDTELLEQRITVCLKQLAVPMNLKGFAYLRSAILLKYQKGNEISSINRELYPLVAERYNTSPQNVERAIRHAIETSFKRHTKYQSDVFGSALSLKTFRPTNNQFIYAVVDELKLYYYYY